MADPLNDPREIRKLLKEVAYRGTRIDGNLYDMRALNMSAQVVGHVMKMSEAQGYSGEDAMTLLAYHALLRYEAALDRLLEQAFLTPSAPVILSSSAKKEG